MTIPNEKISDPLLAGCSSIKISGAHHRVVYQSPPRLLLIECGSRTMDAKPKSVIRALLDSSTIMFG